MNWRELIPQKGSMSLLTEFGGYDSQTGEAIAYVTISESSRFCESGRGVPTIVAIEYMAQTMALANATGGERDPAQIGFLLGSRKFETFAPYFQFGKRYRVKAVREYSDAQYSAFACEVTDDENSVLARATLTAKLNPKPSIIR